MSSNLAQQSCLISPVFRLDTSYSDGLENTLWVLSICWMYLSYWFGLTLFDHEQEMLKAFMTLCIPVRADMHVQTPDISRLNLYMKSLSTISGNKDQETHKPPFALKNSSGSQMPSKWLLEN